MSEAKDEPKAAEELPADPVGGGVERWVLEEAEEAAAEQPAAAAPEFTTSDESAAWSPHPSLTDQFHTYPEHCRVGPQKMRMFQLVGADVAKAQGELNTLLARGGNVGSSPQIIVEDQKIESAPGGFCILVIYREVLYKRLISKSNE